MNNDELKKKFIKIIRQGFATADCRNPYTHVPYPYFDSQIFCIADALIAAGIGDVEKAKKEVNYWKSEVKTARVDIDDAVKEITKTIFTELRDYFVEQSAYAADCNQHTGYYDYEIKASDVVCDIVTIAEKYGVELGAKDDD